MGRDYATRVQGRSQSYAVAQTLHSEAISSETWLGDLPLSLVFGQMVGLETLCDEVSQGAGEVAVEPIFPDLGIVHSTCSLNGRSRKWLLCH